MIKKLFSFLCVGLCTVSSLTACASNAKQENKETANQTTKEVNMDGKKLVVYFSHTGENYNVGYIEEGNTAIIADMIAEATGADKFEIVPEKPYPQDSYEECIEIAQQEKRANARPEIKGDIAIEDYDVIFLGYPNWWGELPMCVYTFIEKHDWNGKTVIPFITHEGSGMGGTDSKIAKATAGSNTLVGKGLAVQGKVAQENRTSAKKSVDNWLTGLGYK
ncbi:MAG: flavodoxin [Muribaculaceae bacterium]|nr:flavodoxin [Muribaculaceae bacterium]